MHGAAAPGFVFAVVGVGEGFDLLFEPGLSGLVVLHGGAVAVEDFRGEVFGDEFGFGGEVLVYLRFEVLTKSLFDLFQIYQMLLYLTENTRSH